MCSMTLDMLAIKSLKSQAHLTLPGDGSVQGGMKSGEG